MHAYGCCPVPFVLIKSVYGVSIGIESCSVLGDSLDRLDCDLLARFHVGVQPEATFSSIARP